MHDSIIIKRAAGNGFPLSLVEAVDLLLLAFEKKPLDTEASASHKDIIIRIASAVLLYEGGDIFAVNIHDGSCFLLAEKGYC